jgi:hypothetical protein
LVNSQILTDEFITIPNNPDFVKFLYILTSFLVVTYTTGCSFIKSIAFCQKSGPSLDFSAGPPTLIYKTRANYSDKIPLTLSEDKTRIVGYPHPRDIYYRGKLAKPVYLRDGFMLDNRGIGPNTCFISMTYEEYALLSRAPAPGELEKMIIDRDPVSEIYNCGNRDQFTDVEYELRRMIRKGQLGKCRLIKN